MSRRKQSNPKPLKRKAEDELEELAEVLKLPTDVLEIRESQQADVDYIVCSHVTIREGTLFGPYGGHIVADVDNNHKNNVLEARDKEGRKVHILPRNDSCAWLKIVRTASSALEANLNVLMDGEEIWCTVSCDIPPNIELKAWYTIRNDALRYSKSGTCNGPAFCLPSHTTCYATNHEFEDHKLALPKTSEEGIETSQKSLSPSRSVHSAGNKESGQEPAVLNGDLLKHEPFSPTSSTSPGSSLEMSQTEQYSENNNQYPGSTSNNFSAFPFRLTSNLPSGGHFIYVPFVPQVGGNRTPATESNGEKLSAKFQCVHCGIAFSNERNLQVHQVRYCSLRLGRHSQCGYNGATGEDGKTELESQEASTESGEASKKEEKETGSTSKRVVDREVSRNDKVDVKHQKSGRQYLCRYCNYTADKKANLTRHMRIHGSPSPTSDCHINEIPIRTPPIARYCSNCDIQFSSYKTYHVHKQFYCNTRHVQKSTPSISSQGNASQTEQSSQTPINQYSIQSQDKSRSPSQLSNPYNLVLNQPVYAAISTNPLILIPCSYVAGNGVTSPSGIIPAGNIIIPSGSPGLNNDSANIIPAFTVMPGGADTKRCRDSTETKHSNSRHDTSDEKLCPQEDSSLGVPQDVDATEKPLDLSLRKHDTSPAVTDIDDGECTKSSISSVPEQQESKIGARNFQLSPLQSALSTTPIIVSPALSTGTLPLAAPTGDTVPQITSQVLVKQGNSKCKECNIVFYKYENYLVHKKHYCAARQQKPVTRSSASPEQKIKDETISSVSDSERKDDENGALSSRMKRPRSSTPGETCDSITHSPPLSQPVYQFYCMACGIKFTSLDNLQAHQTYYCPKREALRGAQSGLPVTMQRQHEFKCSKCKNSYPTEEALKGHPCIVQKKCPYCDVFCPTLSAAQRHLATHTGVKAFRCTICGYKGHTLRGMRTHIRIHLDKGRSTPEETFIVCVDEEGTTIGSPSSRRNSTDRHVQESAAVVDVPCCDSASSNLSASASSGLPEYQDTNGKKCSNQEKSPEQTSEITHWCQLCGYSSSYKGNVVRHVKLVHRERITTQQVQSAVNSRPSEATDFKKAESPVSSTKVENEVTVENGLSINEEVTEASCNTECSNTSVGSSQEKQSATDQNTKVAGPKYCKTCDISFNYLSNFLAHKKFYCTPRTDDVGNQEPAQVQ
ncbi:zinc finger protein ush isoform X1 [Centruroides vittatus]|uniref:zinc finger protein ush isoform X1 n=2 Tax=Centruroides vittatus TaxID=120091 RepID=UPI0035106EF2